MNESTLELKPMDIGGVLDNCFRLYRANFFNFILIAAIPQVLNFIATGAFQYFGFSLTTGDQSAELGLALFAPLIGAIPVIILAWFLHFVATGALAYAVSERYLGHEIGVKEAYGYVFRRIWPLLGALILTGLASSAGFALCIIPGVFLTLFFVFTTQAIVIEKCGVMEGISRSWNLARSNLGKVFVIGLLYFVVVMVIAGIFQVPFVILTVLRARPGLPPVFGLQILQTATGSIGNILANPIFMISFTLLYYDIRIRKEGFDLHVMAENLGYKP